MLWLFGGILLWLGGWWFTGTLFLVYRKAIYFDMQSQRQQGNSAPDHHRAGPLTILLLDLGLLLVGIRCIQQLLKQGSREAHSVADHTADVGIHLGPPLGILCCVYAARAASMFYAFYYDRLKGHGVPPGERTGRPDRWAALWEALAPWGRVTVVFGLLLALLATFGGRFWRPDLPAGLPSSVIATLAPLLIVTIPLFMPALALRKRLHRSSPP